MITTSSPAWYVWGLLLPVAAENAETPRVSSADRSATRLVLACLRLRAVIRLVALVGRHVGSAGSDRLAVAVRHRRRLCSGQVVPAVAEQAPAAGAVNDVAAEAVSPPEVSDNKASPAAPGRPERQGRTHLCDAERHMKRGAARRPCSIRVVKEVIAGRAVLGFHGGNGRPSRSISARRFSCDRHGFSTLFTLSAAADQRDELRLVGDRPSADSDDSRRNVSSAPACSRLQANAARRLSMSVSICSICCWCTVVSSRTAALAV